MAVTLAQAQAQLDAWLKASLDVSEGKSYQLGSNGLKYTREDVDKIQKQITYWSAVVDRLTPVAEGGRRRVRRILPVDL